MKKEGSRKLLWIGWDGADWNHIHPLLDQGLLPNLEKLINEGVMGNLATLQPVLSPMLWNSAATGKYPFEHGIYGFTEPDSATGGVRPFSSYSRKSKALWNMFSSVGLKSNVVNWWASHPAEQINGCVVSNLFQGVKMGPHGPQVGKGAIHPEERARDYGVFKVFPEEIGADQILPFIPRAGEINQDEDGRLDVFAKVLSETLTTHSVATAVMEMEPWDFMAVYYTCIDHFGHGFMGYYPPRQAHIPEEDFELFKDVIPGAYRFSDMMLGRMLEFCDEDTTVVVCSDHGFKSGADRPLGQPREPSGPTVWHRDYGMVVMKGPNIRKDERIYGASLIDITPTLLTVMGLPVGRDMSGRVLLDAFVEPPEIQWIDSWEDFEGEFDDGVHRGEEQALAAEEAEDLINQFVALGYVDDPSGDKVEQFEAAELESKYNCGRSLMFSRRFDEALPLFEEVARRATWENRFVLQLAECYRQCGYLRQAQRVLESAFDLKETKSKLVVLQWVEIEIEAGNTSKEVLELLRQTEESLGARATSALSRVARIYAGLRKWEDARRVNEAVIKEDPANVYALQALSRIYSRLDLNQEAAEAALDAVGLVHRLPHAHMNLGIAMARLGEFDRAEMAFLTALKFSPGFVQVHRLLAILYQNRMGKPGLALKHRELAKEYLGRVSERKQDQRNRMSRIFDLPEFPTEEERYEILLNKRPDQTNKKRASGKEFVLVSGLPRSGTSLMMQMLEAGGLVPKTDGERGADSDNPKGYYEWEAVKQVGKLPMIMDEPGLQGKAIKVISMLLKDMPYQHCYKIIFMTRPAGEVAASQKAMIERLESHGPERSLKELESILEAHRDSTRKWMSENPRVEFLEVDYPELVKAPEKVIPQIVEFLGEERLANFEAMSEVVDPSLKRQGS